MAAWRWLVPGFLLAASCGSAQAEWKPDVFVFARQADGAARLGARDEYVAQLTPLDRAMRLETDDAVSEAEYLGRAAKSVQDWSDAERTALQTDIAKIIGTLDALHVPVPKEVLLIKTDGTEEGHAAYTRGDAIVLPQKLIDEGAEAGLWLLAHELFHVISRENPGLRDPLYAAIGFNRVDPFPLPADIAAHLVTNPDALALDHFIRVTVDDEDVCATPLLTFAQDQYDRAQGGDFTDQMKERFLISRHIADRQDGVPKDLRVATKNRVFGFQRQVGENTAYTIHPEEIVADNFALMVTGLMKAQSPEVLDRIRAVFAHEADPGAPAPEAPLPCP